MAFVLNLSALVTKAASIAPTPPNYPNERGGRPAGGRNIFSTDGKVKTFAHFFNFSTCVCFFSRLFSVDIAAAYDKMTTSLKG
jgi:hypothetical protein